MSLKGNKGDWSEPYALLRLIADGKLYLGGNNYNKIKGKFYPIIEVIRNEKNRKVKFSYNKNNVEVKDGKKTYTIPINDFIKNADYCFVSIKAGAPKAKKNANNKTAKSNKGAFEIPVIEKFLNSFSIKTLKAKSQLKNDINVKINDPKTFLSPELGFSVKSQLGRPSTLVNSSVPTNFTYTVVNKVLSNTEIQQIEALEYYSDKLELLKKFGAKLEYDQVENETFRSNLQTIDFYFDKILAEMVLMYYENNIPGNNRVDKFIKRITKANPLNYNLKVNNLMYELMMKKFLSDYALGMRAAEPWKRNYQATGGYLIVKDNGELICYHFYFAKTFEDYLFNNTKLDTGDDRNDFGKIYTDNNGVQKMKLNLQIRFLK